MNKLENIKMVAFDVGDTLYSVSHPELLTACWNAEMVILRENKLLFTNAEYSKAAEKAWRESQKIEYKGDYLAVPKLVQKFLGYEIDDELTNKMAESFEVVIKNYKIDKEHIMDGALDLIHTLHNNGFKLGIISDTKTSWAREWIKELGVDSFFNVIILSNEIGAKKAAFKPFEVFCDECKNKFNILPEEIVMIGDLSVDMDAKKANMHTILFNPANLSYEHFECEPDFSIKELKDIKDILL